MELSVVNMVATTHIGRSLDLDLLSVVLRDVGDVKYEPDRFPGLIVKSKNVGYLIFRTGKVVVVGCKSVEEVDAAVRRILRAVSSVVGDVPNDYTIQIQNLVVTAELGREVDLETLSERLEHSMYIPEEFPGLIYKPGVGKPSALIFSTGRVVVVGATSVEDAQRVVREIEATVAGADEGGVEAEDIVED